MLVAQINSLGLLIMESLWTRGPCSIREVHDALPKDERPQINTTRAAFYRLVHNGYARQVKQVNHAAVFEASVSRDSVYDSAIDSFAELFADDMGAVVARLVETGRLTAADLTEMGRVLRDNPPNGPRSRRPKLVSSS